MKNNARTIVLSLLVMALWGSLFPMIKLGYQAFDIRAGFIPDILMFASIRFMISGLIVSVFCYFKKEKVAEPKEKSISNIIRMGFFSIVLHYGLYYIGLSTTDSSKAALIKQLGSLIYVCFAFLFFKEEKFSISKIAGAIIGFGGIMAINYSPNGFRFAFGDILIIGASICTVIANVISKKSVEGSSPYWITGISQLFGGIVLFIAAIVMGANLLKFNQAALLILGYICAASIGSYTLWYYVLKHNSLSKMFIIKFAEPLFACLFSAVILGEDILKWQYLIAFVFISLGIVLGNKSDTAESSKSEFFQKGSKI